MHRQRSRTPQPTTVVVPCFGVSAVVGGNFDHRNRRKRPPKSGQVICCCRLAYPWWLRPMRPALRRCFLPRLCGTCICLAVGRESRRRFFWIALWPSQRPWERRRTGSVRRKHLFDLRHECRNVVGTASSVRGRFTQQSPNDVPSAGAVALVAFGCCCCLPRFWYSA